MKKKSKCKAGYYYCYTDKKCKPIPSGFKVVGPAGMLRKENGHSIDDESETETKKNGNGSNGNGNGNGGGSVSEDNKSGDNSLRDWFGKSRSSDGKPGWVQLGGKYAGKPCAKQPGQTTKPKCGSSKMKRNLSKDEEEAAFRRKNRQDPNPDRKGKAINVKTEETLVNERDDLNQMQKDADANRDRAAKLKDRNVTRGSASLAAAKVADDVKKAARTGPQQHKGTRTGVKKIEKPKPTYTKTGVISKEETINERGDYWHPDPDKDRKLGGPGPNQRAREDRGVSKSSSSSSSSAKPKLRPGESYMEYSKRMKTQLKKESVEIQEGEKDACYHKVKSRYSVWPSAYASGALVKCRKVGAKNWGNKTKKEGYEFSNWRDDFKAFDIESIDLIKPDPLEATKGIGSEMLGEKCWPGYEKKGMKTMFGKRYPNCVKKTRKEEVEQIDEKKDCMHNYEGEECPVHGKKECPNLVKEAVQVPRKTGQIVRVFLTFRGKMYIIQMFFPSVVKPSREEVQAQIEKVYPGGKVRNYDISDYEPGQPLLHTEGAAWTKKAGKSESGGLNEKGRKSYERENPGSDLKAPSKKVGNPRRKSFCARMKGMKKKLTSSKTANDPDSRINKSLRAWNC